MPNVVVKLEIPKDFYFFRDKSLMVKSMTTVENKLIHRFESFVLGFCKCGCNIEIPIRNKLRILQQFKHGHNGKDKKGKDHQSYKKGYYNDNGYTRVLKSEYINKELTGYTRYHRLIYEEYYNCCLLPWIHLHHIVPINKGGKDKVENLQPLTVSQHMSITMKGNKHGKKDMSNRFCLNCGSKETRINNKNGYSQWYSYKNGYLCDICGRKHRYKQKSKLKIFNLKGGDF